MTSHCNHSNHQNNHPDDYDVTKLPEPDQHESANSASIPVTSCGVELVKRQPLVDPDYAVVTHHSKRQRTLDPDYEEITASQNKRQRILEEDAKEATKRKIERIIQAQFLAEIHNKQTEVGIIDQRLNQARSMIDRLRACIVANFYGTASQQGISQGKLFPNEIPSIHPAVKKHLGKAPTGTGQTTASQSVLSDKKILVREITLISDSAVPVTTSTIKKEPVTSSPAVVEVEKSTKVSSSASSNRLTETTETKRGSRFRVKKKIIVGNVSKFVPLERRDVNDQASHKWMVYVRGPQDEPKINDFVKKVWFFLHPSYRPNDLVEISQPPFHLTRRGWGEFPVRVQLHFWDSRNKRVDIIHQLMLDKTCTGLQTLGSETVVEIELEKEEVEETCSNSIVTPATSHKKKKPPSNKHSPRKRFKSEEKDDSESISHIKQELGDGDAEIIHEENTKANIKLEKHSTKVAKVKNEKNLTNVEHKNKRKLSVTDSDTECKINHVDCDRKPNISNTGSADIRSDNQNGGRLKSGTHSHRKNIKLKHNLPKHLDSCIPLGGKDVSESSILEQTDSNSSKTSVTLTSQKSVTASLNSNHNGLTLPVNSQGKEVSRGKEVNKSSPKVSVLKAPTSKSQMYIKSTDAKGNVVLQLIGERSPNRNVDNSLVMKTGQVSLLDGKKKLCSAGQRQSNYALILGSSTSASTSLCSSSVNQIRFSLTSSSCGNTSDSVSQSSTVISGVNSTKISVAPVSFVNSSKISAASVSFVNSSKISAAPVSFVNSSKISAAPVSFVNSSKISPAPVSFVNSSKNSCTQVSGVNSSNGSGVNSSNTNRAPVSGVHSVHEGGTPVLQVNSSNISGAQVSGVNSSHTSPPAVQSVRLVVTPQGLKMIPVIIEDKGSNSNPSSVPTLQKKSELHNKINNKKCLASAKSSFQSVNTLLQGSTDGKNNPVSGTPQLMLANIGDQTFVLKVVPNQIPNFSTGTENVPKHGEISHVTNTGVTNLPPTQFTNKINTSSASVVGNKNSPVINSSTCNKIQTTNQNVTLNISKSSSNQPVGISTKSTNQDQSYIHSLLKMPFSSEEKKMLVLRKDKEREKEVREEIPNLKLSDYSDMLSLVRAAVRRHPVVKDTRDQVTHPYCATSTEQWLHWNIGKRRASEWHRASTVRRYITRHLEDGHSFKGEQLWTTKQIVVWCRLHAYSPHYLEKLSIPQSGFSKGERIPSSVNADDENALNTKLSSLSEPGPLTARLSSLLESVDNDGEASSSEEEIEILSVDQPKVKMKQEVKATISHPDPLYLPMSDHAVFIQEINQKIGVNFQPTEIEDGVFGSASEDVIFDVMKLFMEDILREAFKVKATKDNPDSISAVDVFEGLMTLPTADFLTNKYLGAKDDRSVGDNS